MSALTPYRAAPNDTRSLASPTRLWRRDLLLLWTIFFFFPVCTLFVFLTTLSNRLPGFPVIWKKQSQKSTIPFRRILITGASTPLALTLARILYAEGHIVLAADYEELPLASPARASRAVKKFYTLNGSATTANRPAKNGSTEATISRLGSISHTSASFTKGSSDAQLYAQDIGAIARHVGGVDLWIPCDQNTPRAALAAAREIITKAGGGAIYPDPKFALIGSDDFSFAECVGALETPIKAPERRIVQSRGEIHRILHGSPRGRQYLLERIQPTADAKEKGVLIGNGTKHDSGTALTSVSSSVSSSTGWELVESVESVILPQSSVNETYRALASRPISVHEPWILHELIADTGTEVATHSLVVDSAVKAFIATSSSTDPTSASFRSTPSTTSVLTGSGAMTVSSTSALHSTLLAFTTAFAAALPTSASAHLSLTFQLHETPTATGTATVVIPTSCTTTPHASLALLSSPTSDPTTAKKIAAAYLSAAEPKELAITNGNSSHETTTVLLPASIRSSNAGLYSLPNLVLDLLVLPVLGLVLLRASIADVVAALAKFGEQVVFGVEERWAWGDGGSWWWEWHVKYPLEVFSGYLPRKGTKSLA